MEVNLLRKLAWSFHRTTGIPFEDLFQEAALTWTRLENNMERLYNPSKSSFKTWAYICTRAHLQTIATKRGKEPKTTLLDNEIQDRLQDRMPSPQRFAEFNELLRNLSMDAKFVVLLIFESPHEFLGGRREAKRKLALLLKDRYGFSGRRIKEAIREVTELVE